MKYEHFLSLLKIPDVPCLKLSDFRSKTSAHDLPLSGEMATRSLLRWDAELDMLRQALDMSSSAATDRAALFGEKVSANAAVGTAMVDVLVRTFLWVHE